MKSLLAALVSGIVVNSPAVAQHLSAEQSASQTVEIRDSAPAFRQFGNVEITGSSIVRKEQTQALPVQVMTREDIRRSGLKSVSEVVQALPLMGNFVESAQLGMVAGGFNGAAIHGMPNGTLVLVDGLRMAPFGRPTVVGPERSGTDLSTLPLADVERVEVLTDGASSLYGTDAIAGVVNIILRKERKGLEITADLVRPQGGAGQGRMASIGWGQGQLQRDGYSLMVTAEVSERKELLGRDRPYATAGRPGFELDGQAYRVRTSDYTGFWASDPATFIQLSPRRVVNSYFVNGQCASLHIPAANQAACIFNGYPALGIYPEEEAQRLHARGELALHEGQTVFADLLMGQSLAVQSNNWWPRVDAQAGLVPGSAAYIQAEQAGLDAANTLLFWRPHLPALRSASEQTSTRLQVGIRGAWDAWRYQGRSYLTQHRARSLADTFGDLNYNGLGLAYGGILNDPDVLRPLDASNPLTAQVQALRGNLKRASTGTTRQYGLQAQASRALGEIDGKDVELGVGMDLRTETSRFANLVPTELQSEPPGFDVRRQVGGVFAELQIPVTTNWDVNLGGRTDRYSDVGSTTNAKAFSRWQINPAWAMRGSVGTGFRAPSVAQTQTLGTPFVWAYSTGLGLSCDAAQEAITRQLSASSGITGTCIPGSKPFILGNGNPDLKPEKSIQMTWGLAFMPQRNLRLAADLWSVRIRDRIQVLSDTLVLKDPGRYAANYRLIPEGYSNSGTTPGALALYLPLQNLGESEKTGIDLEAQWRHPGEWGRWSLSAQATYLLRSRSKASPNAPFTSDLGRYDDSAMTVSPRLRARVMAGLSRQNWSAFLVLNHTSAYQDAAVSATHLTTGELKNVTRRVRAFTTWDLQCWYAFNRQLELRAGIRNLFNQPAPLSFAQTSSQVFGANTVYSNLWGRSLDLGMTFRF